jgi:hypothetical protein
MDVIAGINSINVAIQTVTRLREISKNIAEAEFKNLLADLSNQLADAKLEVAALKEESARLHTELLEVRQSSGRRDEKPVGKKYGCYLFKDDTELYCPACWDARGKKSTTNRVDIDFRRCPVCHEVIGAS